MPSFLLLMTALAVIHLVALAALAKRCGRMPEYDERHPVHTADGWTLALHRLRPAAGVRAHPVPVILGHGVTMNRTCWELSYPSSMVRALSRRGHDVWIAEYRGSRSSRPPRGLGWARNHWRIQDHAQEDLPAIIDEVRRRSGSQKVNWVGHSMGGMVLYLYAGAHGCAALHRVVTLGSPVRMFAPRGLLGSIEGFFGALLALLPKVPLRLFAALYLPLAPLTPRSAYRTWFHMKNVRPIEALRNLWLALDDSSPRLLSWFANERRASRPLRLASPDGHTNGPDPLPSLTAPLLVIAAQSDRLATPRSVRPAYDHAASPRAAFVLCGDADSLDPLPDFGHCDLISSAASMEHIAPLLAAWLEGEEPSCDRATVQRSPS